MDLASHTFGKLVGAKKSRKQKANRALAQLKNGSDSETSTTKDSSTDVDLEVSSSLLHKSWFQIKMSREQRRPNLLSNITPMPPTNSSNQNKSRQFKYLILYKARLATEWLLGQFHRFMRQNS